MYAPRRNLGYGAANTTARVAGIFAPMIIDFVSDAANFNTSYGYRVKCHVTVFVVEMKNMSWTDVDQSHAQTVKILYR